MRIEFEDLALEELYTNGTTTDGKYRKLRRMLLSNMLRWLIISNRFAVWKISSILNHFIMRKRKVI